MSEDVKELVELASRVEQLAGDAADETFSSPAHMYLCAKLGAEVASNIHLISPALRSYQSLKEENERLRKRFGPMLADMRGGLDDRVECAVVALECPGSQITNSFSYGTLRKAREELAQALNTGDKNETADSG